MKVVSYILSFYLVLLSVVPCCSFDNCPDDRVEQTAGNHSDEGDCGSCSPFFSCEGCASASIIAQHDCVDIISLPVSKSYSDFIVAFLTPVHYDFWQPPRLG